MGGQTEAVAPLQGSDEPQQVHQEHQPPTRATYPEAPHGDATEDEFLSKCEWPAKWSTQSERVGIVQPCSCWPRFLQTEGLRRVFDCRPYAGGAGGVKRPAEPLPEEDMPNGLVKVPRVDEGVSPALYGSVARPAGDHL